MESTQSTTTAKFDADFLSLEHNHASVHAVSLADGFEMVFIEQYPDPVAAASVSTVQMFKAQGGTATAGLTITEMSNAGTVSRLVAHNTSEHDFLLIAGQIVAGGKQNRGINADILIGAGKSTDIPVTCVQQGRWSGPPADRFRSSGFEPVSIRAAKMRQVQDSRRANRGHDANQHAVWAEISSISQAIGARSDSSDLIDALSHSSRAQSAGSSSNHDLNVAMQAEARCAELAHLRSFVADLRGRARVLQDAPPEISAPVNEALRNAVRRLNALRSEQARAIPHGPQNNSDQTINSEKLAQADASARTARGMLVFFHGEFLAGDIFAENAWFGDVYRDLRDSALLSWDVSSRRRGHERRPVEPASDTSTESQTRSIVRDALQGQWRQQASIAQGHTYLLEHARFEGCVLTSDAGTPLHLLLGTKSDPESLRQRH